MLLKLTLLLAICALAGCSQRPGSTMSCSSMPANAARIAPASAAGEAPGSSW